MNFLLPMLSMELVQLGTFLKNKDTNSTGKDDALGNVMLAVAPAIAAIDGNDIALRKALKAARDSIDNFLTTSPAG